jgi:surface antigen
MRIHRLASFATAAALVSIATVGSTAVASSTPLRHRHAASKKCGNPSRASTKPSRYNRTPKGAGPWHVPLDKCNTEGVGSSSTPYYNCAYWAAEKRPDIWVNAVIPYGYSKAHPGAWRIRPDAKKAGYPINHRPKVGDLAVWGRSASMGTAAGGVTYTASAGGHVSYVEKVFKHGRVSISSMGVSSDGGETSTLTFDKKQTFFIHAK